MSNILKYFCIIASLGGALTLICKAIHSQDILCLILGVLLIGCCVIMTECPTDEVTEPESPFKVGDKVVINCREEFATAYNGKEGTIINIFDLEKNHWGNIVVVLDNGMRNTFYASELIKK